MQTFTAAVKIRSGREDDLRQVLRTIDGDINGNSVMRLPDSHLTHFLRFVIIDDPDNGPRLLVAANYDGTQEAYLRELASVSPGLDELWSACEGYAGRDSFVGLLQRNSFPSQAAYLGFADETVASLRAYAAIRREIERVLGLKEVGRYLDGPDLSRLLEMLGQLPPGASPAMIVGGLAALATARAQEVSQRLFREVFLWGAEKFSKAGEGGDFSRVTTLSADANDPKRQTEQAIDLGGHTVQNEMTTLTTVRPERLNRLRFALLASRALFRFGWPAGEFADVGSLHSFAWVLMDGNQRLLFLSAFDGSWQNYLGDFRDKLIWGLDGLYSNTYGYPRNGMADLGSFTRFILDRQFPHAVFYSAYPQSTVMNLLRDRKICQTLAGSSGARGMEQWLQLL